MLTDMLDVDRVRRLFVFILVIAVLAATPAQYARADGDAVYLTTYVEVMPNAVVGGAALLERYRDASRKQSGNLRFDVLREIARPNRFAILEAWKDQGALDGHSQAASSSQFRERLQAIQTAPYDERVGLGTYVGTMTSESRAGTIYVLTHVDVLSAYKDACLALLKAMSIDTAVEAGSVGYQVLQQANRANHFTVAEEWTSSKAQGAHVAAAHTREYREKLSPMLGALYDERLYKELN